jgi:hypothetical protein
VGQFTGKTNYTGTTKGFRPDQPSFDTDRLSVPTVLTTIEPSKFNLFYLEIANNTGGDVTAGVFDAAGMAVIPTQTIKNGAILDYRSDFGTPVQGLAWMAGEPGLVGWFCGAYV